jgi:protein tyrosine phosphatase (PTP) superfamily phosphohydrolase (DUF442 family)
MGAYSGDRIFLEAAHMALHRSGWLGVALSVLAFAGCEHCCQKVQSRPLGGLFCGPCKAPAPPPGAAGAPIPPQPELVAPPPPAPVSPEIRNYPPGPVQQSAWRPNEPAVHLLVPETRPQVSETETRGQPAEPVPQVTENPKQAAPAETPAPPKPKPPTDAVAPAKEESKYTEPKSATLPSGIPQFAMAEDQVAAGLKPLLEGLDWLKDNGYKTVLHVRKPNEDDAADRKQVEKRGLKFEVLEVSPDTLSDKTVKSFNKIVANKDNLPLFVYDKDGALAGGLWYLHFRSSQGATDAFARQKAGRLGLKDTQNGDQKLMWLAIQKYLADTAR